MQLKFMKSIKKIKLKKSNLKYIIIKLWELLSTFLSVLSRLSLWILWAILSNIRWIIFLGEALENPCQSDIQKDWAIEIQIDTEVIILQLIGKAKYLVEKMNLWLHLLTNSLKRDRLSPFSRSRPHKKQKKQL